MASRDAPTGTAELLSIFTAIWDWRARSERTGEPYDEAAAKKGSPAAGESDDLQLESSMKVRIRACMYYVCMHVRVWMCACMYGMDGCAVGTGRRSSRPTSPSRAIRRSWKRIPSISRGSNAPP